MYYHTAVAHLVLENPVSAPGFLYKELKPPEQRKPLSVPFGLQHAVSRLELQS